MLKIKKDLSPRKGRIKYIHIVTHSLNSYIFPLGGRLDDFTKLYIVNTFSIQ